VEWLVRPIANVNKSTPPVTLLCLHLLVDEVEGVYVTRKVTKNREYDVNQKIAATACNEGSGCWREYYGNKNEENVGSFDHVT